MGYLEVFLIEFDTDEITALNYGGNSGCSTAHRIVEDGLAWVGIGPYQIAAEINAFLSGVLCAFLVLLADGDDASGKLEIRVGGWSNSINGVIAGFRFLAVYPLDFAVALILVRMLAPPCGCDGSLPFSCSICGLYVGRDS